MTLEATNKEKQIEEMAKIMCGFNDEECEHCITCSYHNGCVCEEDAKNLYNLGYRKASEVAREIFAEIEEIAIHSITSFGLCLMSMGEVAFAELKKKYTEERQENA